MEQSGHPRARPLGGGLWACVAYFSAILAAGLGLALFVPGDGFVYDVTLAWVLVAMGSASVSLWLIFVRAHAARGFILASLGVTLGLWLCELQWGGGIGIEEGAPGAASVAVDAVYGCLSLAILVYVALSPSVRATLSLPLGESAGTRPANDPDEVRYSFERPFSWPWWRNLGIYYAASSIIGHWGEIAFCWLIVLGIFDGHYDFSHAQLWQEWLYPYPAEGIAAVLCVVVLYPFKQWLLERFKGEVFPTLVVSFFVIMAVCCAVDFLTGVTVNWDYHLWDYRDLPFNFMGQVMLQNTLVYSVIATFAVWVLYPWAARLLHRARPAAVNGAFFAFAGAYAFLEVLYFVNVTPTGLAFG